MGLAFWLRATYITPDTGKLASWASERSLAFDSVLIAQAKALKDVRTDPESARAIELILRGSSMPAPNDPALRAELAQLATDMEGLYGAGKACDDNGDNCKTLPELENKLAASRDNDEQLEACRAWREVSPSMRLMYQRFVELANQGARELGFANLGEQWKGGYDLSTAEFEAETQRLWGQVEPFYEALHCHLRDTLFGHYGEDLVSREGPIPTHLLGNMWAQSWGNICDLLEPYPGVAPLDETSALQVQNYHPVRMAETAEDFLLRWVCLNYRRVFGRTPRWWLRWIKTRCVMPVRGTKTTAMTPALSNASRRTKNNWRRCIISWVILTTT